MVSEECDGVWGRDMGVERVGKCGKSLGKVYEVGVGGRWEDNGIFGEGGREEGENEDEAGKEGDGV